LEKEMIEFIFTKLSTMLWKEETDFLGITDLPYNDIKSVTMTIAEAKQILGTVGHNMGDMTDAEEVEIGKYVKEKHGTDFVFLTKYHIDARPFYSKLLPNSMFSNTFDLIYKGTEITSGGQREENHDALVKMMGYKGMNQTAFKDYLNAFKWGMPLHGGFALGLERLTAKICNLDNVKLATLFPRDIERLTP
jgi:nondiscriminating aspartyl-tRNA synthetase